MSETLRSALKSALTAFATQPLREASLGFFKTLGYTSQRTVLVPKSSPRAFLDLFAKPSAPGTGAPAPFDQAKALFADWLAADLLFQLTDQELSREVSLFPDTAVSASQLRSYIFFAVELKDREYPRGKLAGLARQLNRLFPTPVMVLIKHRDLITLAVINRRPNKLDQSKDVLGRVTLIRDIVPTAPHRGHLDILVSLTTSQLVHPQKKPIFQDDGNGMKEQELRQEYLNIASPRISRKGDRTPNLNRLVKGRRVERQFTFGHRRGVGKFSGLILADEMEVVTRAHGTHPDPRHHFQDGVDGRR